MIIDAFQENYVKLFKRKSPCMYKVHITVFAVNYPTIV